MSSKTSNTPEPAAPTAQLPPVRKANNARKATVGSTAAAVTLAAVTVLSVSGLVGAPSSGLDSAGIISSPPGSVSSRIAGVQEDMARAVQLQQITPEQAAFLEKQLIRRIQGGSETA